MPLLIIYLVAIIEWFSTLAVEIIAIRLATPIVGSSIILTSVFLGVILLALSAGYYVGGIVASRYSAKRLILILWAYLIFAWLYYLLISFSWEKRLLQQMLIETQDYILTLFVVAITLFFIPVFIASQTMPILTELIDETSKGKAAGKILFASTLGSFLGSVLTSIVLFQTFGVQVTGILVGCSLLVCTAILRHKEYRRAALVALACGLLSGFWMISTVQEKDPKISYQFDSAYQEIVVRNIPYRGKDATFFMTDGAYSSAIYPDTKESPFEYIIKTIDITNQLQPKNILVIWTAWFTFPYQVAKLPFVQNIDAVDIDPRVKPIAEEHFLQDTLSDKITFHPLSARFFINQAIQEWTTYDLIFVDAYNGKSIPDELTTQEFFSDLQKISTNDQIVFNFILDRKLEGPLAKNLLGTVSSVFPTVTYQYATPSTAAIANVLVTTTEWIDKFQAYEPEQNVFSLYTDDRRSTELDTIQLYR